MSLQNNFKKLVRAKSSTSKLNWKEIASEHEATAKSRERSTNIALRVLQALNDKGLSQAGLAQKLKVSRQYISSIVKGKANFTLETIGDLEDALEIELIKVYEPGHEDEIEKEEYQSFYAGTIKSEIKSVANDSEVSGGFVSITDIVAKKVIECFDANNYGVPIVHRCEGYRRLDALNSNLWKVRPRTTLNDIRNPYRVDFCNSQFARQGSIHFTTKLCQDEGFLVEEELYNRQTGLS